MLNFQQYKKWKNMKASISGEVTDGVYYQDFKNFNPKETHKHVGLYILVALILYGDVPKWSGQGHFEDTSGTRPGLIRDMSGRRHIFRQFWARTWDKFEK